MSVVTEPHVPRKTELAPRPEILAAGIGFAFVTNALAAVLLRMHCDLTLGLTGLEKTACDNVAGVSLLLVLGAPVGVALAGGLARRLHKSLIFHIGWVTGSGIGIAFVSFI
jgi:hypothetical protein